MPRRTKNFADAVRAKLAENHALAEAVESERASMGIASAILSARMEAKLTQSQLAHATGMQQSAIARLEGSDYDGYTVSTLRRIAEAMGKRLYIEFCPASAARSSKKNPAPRALKAGSKKKRGS